MSISIDEFVQSLTETGILPPDELSSIVGSLPVDKTRVDVERLARDLVRQQKLTRFQASAIFQGQSRGLRFGDYVVLDKIGSGSMGQVFKAENRKRKKIVALKLLRASLSKSERVVRRFYREAEMAKRLKHPNLIRVRDAGQWHGLHFLVMDYIDGQSLQALPRERGPLSVADALDIIIQAARGLDYAHRNGIVHRDIKPANLLVDKSGRVTILDLGLARLDDACATAQGSRHRGRLTMPGQMMGTVNYISPEQAMDAHAIDGRADIYSLGCTMHYLLRGQAPYRRDNAALTLMAHCEAPIPSLREAISEVSERLDAAFRKMLAKQPANRFATMAEVILELEACLGQLAPPPASGTQVAPDGPVAGRPSEPALTPPQ